ncbi:MAG: hypothetical protein H6Q15_2602 [Bacteroidetes bacterium]|nr:hypothetical protein [Bacteroidota bacterium]
MKVTLKNILFIFITEKGGATVVLSLIMIFFGKDIFSSTFGQILFSIVFIITYLPSIYLQIEYYFRNRNMEVSIVNKSFIIKRNGEQKTIEFEDIDHIIEYPSGTKKGESLFGAAGITLGCYHYMRIITKSEEEIIITFLMYPKLYELFDTFDGVKTYKLYPWFPSTFIK